MSIHRRFVMVTMTCALLICPAFAAAQDEELKPNPAGLLEDFLHLVLIARPTLAVTAGEALLGAVKDEMELLDTVEASPRRKQVEKILDRATQFPTVRDTAMKIKAQLFKAANRVARNPARIKENIRLLNQGARKYQIGVERLRAAGQFAAKYMLQYLVDDGQRALHSYILRAMVDIGRDLVYPICVALPHLPPASQQQLAGVLMGIGYPRAVPYLKQILEDPATGPDVRVVAEKAYNDLIRTAVLAPDATAAQWFHHHGNDFYVHGTRSLPVVGFDDFENVGVHWVYVKSEVLTKKTVAPQIYADTRAMEMAQQSLALDKELSPAHTLWLIANLRRDIRLNEGDTDEFYTNPLPATVHIKIAGPERQHEVLDRALGDLDPTVARRAIAALRVTLGSDGLIKEEGGPLVKALAFRGDRRVAIEAAIALTRARPAEAYEEHHKVIPVLTEAFKQSATRYAVVVGSTDERSGKLAGMAKDGLGYTTLASAQLADAKLQEEIKATPGINLILIDAEEIDVDNQLAAAANDTSLSAAPIVVIVGDEETLAKARRAFRDDRRVFVVLRLEGEGDVLIQQRIADSIKNYTGPSITEDEALSYAMEALDLLEGVALIDGIYKATDAQGSLIAALKDPRDQVAIGAGNILALLGNEESQRSIAESALDSARSTEVRVEFLNSLADSIKTHDNFLLEPQIADVMKLVTPDNPDLMEAAARVQGALGLTTVEDAVEQIVNPQSTAPAP